MIRTWRISILYIVLLATGGCGFSTSLSGEQPGGAAAPPAPVATAAATAPSAAPASAVPADATSAAGGLIADLSATKIPAVGNEAAATPAPSPAASVDSAPRALEATWYQDSDGNVIPDFMEQELGYDPQRDDADPDACGPAGEGADYFTKTRNTLVMLDSSGSMAGGKLDVAKRSINTYVRVACVVDAVGFLVYGHKGDNSEAGRAASCEGIDLLAPIGTVSGASFQGVLDQFQPTGWTPIAGALTAAGAAFAGMEGQINRILLVSDGIETCGGDPVAVAQALHSQGLSVEVNVIGFDIQDQAAAEQLRQIAEVTGGSYYDAQTAAELEAYLGEQTAAIGQTWAALDCQINNGFFDALTDTTMVNRATQRIRELQYEERDPAREQAYKDLIDAITAGLDSRAVGRREALARAEELRAKYNELREQLSAAIEG